MVLNKVMKHKFAQHFAKPVVHVALNIPDYPKIIKNPMDLGTVEKRLKSGLYSNPGQIGDDMRLIWNNAMTYNPKHTSFYHMTTVIKDHFEKCFREVEENPYSENVSFNASRIKQYDNKLKGYASKARTARQNIDLEKPMSYEEKKVLSESIRSKQISPSYFGILT